MRALLVSLLVMASANASAGQDAAGCIRSDARCVCTDAAGRVVGMPAGACQLLTETRADRLGGGKWRDADPVRVDVSEQYQQSSVQQFGLPSLIRCVRAGGDGMRGVR